MTQNLSSTIRRDPSGGGTWKSGSSASRASESVIEITLCGVSGPMSSRLDSEVMSSYLYMDMDNDVRKRRLQRGLSQAELARAMSVSRQTINSIETGRYIPSLPLALALGRFFGVPVEEMFDADE